MAEEFQILSEIHPSGNCPNDYNHVSYQQSAMAFGPPISWLVGTFPLKLLALIQVSRLKYQRQLHLGNFLLLFLFGPLTLLLSQPHIH